MRMVYNVGFSQENQPSLGQNPSNLDSSVLKYVADLSELVRSQWFARKVALLGGQHLLWCYIAHFVVLKSFQWTLRPHRGDESASVALVLVLTYMLLVFSSWTIELARHRFLLADRVYRLAFA
jgi:hypothetical protein